MSFWWQAVCFPLPGAVIYVGVFYGVPRLVAKGWALIYAFWLCLWAPTLLLPSSLVLYAGAEGGTLAVEALSERLRLLPLAGGDWL